MSLIIKCLVSVAAIYCLVLAGMYVGQRRLLYHPDPARTPPAEAGLRGFEERIIETPDGQRLVTWYSPAKPGQPTLLYFHGNGGPLTYRAELIAKYQLRGRGVMIMAYRGYSGSTGSPKESDNIADAKFAFDTLVKMSVKPADIILYGESLGSGVAVQVAVARPAAGVILDAPFTSIADRAAELYPWVPVRWLLKDRYESIRFIKDLKQPLMIVHGEADWVVPVAMGRRLYEAANQPKQIATFPGAGHNNHDLYGSFKAIDGWIERLRAGGLAR